MKQKRHTTEEIIRIIREADGGKNLEAVCRKHNVSPASFYRLEEEVWRDGAPRRPPARGSRSHRRGGAAGGPARGSPAASAATTAASSSPAPCKAGWPTRHRSRPSTSNRPAPGRTGTWRASTGRCETSAWIARTHAQRRRGPRVLIGDDRRYYNEARPHGGIGYRTPAQAWHEAQASGGQLCQHPTPGT